MPRTIANPICRSNLSLDINADVPLNPRWDLPEGAHHVYVTGIYDRVKGKNKEYVRTSVCLSFTKYSRLDASDKEFLKSKNLFGCIAIYQGKINSLTFPENIFVQLNQSNVSEYLLKVGNSFKVIDNSFQKRSDITKDLYERFCAGIPTIVEFLPTLSQEKRQDLITYVTSQN